MIGALRSEKMPHLIEHDSHCGTSKLGHVFVLVELLRGCENLAAAEEVADPVRLLQPAPVFVSTVELHVLSKQCRALVRCDRFAMLFDLLAHCQAIADVLPRLLNGTQAVSSNDSIALCSDACLPNDCFIIRAQTNGDEQHFDLTAV